MKKFLACTKTTIILLIAAVISLGFYVYMLARPISYGMEYHNESVYEGGTFEGKMTFYPNRTMVNRNTNFDEEIKSRYYYKDGYIFYTLAETDEEYEEEIASINENFDKAIETLFYADEINSFKLIATEGDGFVTVYTCKPAIVFAIVGGVVELVIVGFALASVILGKKKRIEAEDC